MLGTLLLCWPDTRVAEVQAATGLRGWAVGLLLEDMEEAGLVRRTELGWQPLRQAALRGGSAARLAVHRVMATLLAPGHASRFWHLLWCGSPEEVAEEALCRATVLEEEGKLGEVRQVLEEALRQCSENRLLQRRALCVRVDQDRPEVLVGAESLVRGDPEAGRMLELTRLARGGKADTPLPMEGEQPSIDPALWGRTAAARFQALASIYGPEQLLQREAALLEELQGQVPEAPDAQGRLEGWRGLHEFRKGEYKKAAAAHQKAAEYRRGIGRLAARDNAARALLFAGEVEEAERVAATLQEEARALRHPSMEAQALWLQRFAYNIRGGRSPWPVWLAAMAEV
ncbi:MAG TPA: hypothetical protein PKW90_29050, partial [Myxococcota bacterium]|nr:hypothetical protein [Myxococcota bacterium]